jgi:hypothetical protein
VRYCPQQFTVTCLATRKNLNRSNDNPRVRRSYLPGLHRGTRCGARNDPYTSFQSRDPRRTAACANLVKSFAIRLGRELEFAGALRRTRATTASTARKSRGLPYFFPQKATRVTTMENRPFDTWQNNIDFPGCGPSNSGTSGLIVAKTCCAYPASPYGIRI